MFGENKNIQDFFNKIPITDTIENKIKESFSNINVKKTYDIEGTDSGDFVFESIPLSDKIIFVEYVNKNGESRIKCRKREENELEKSPDNNTVYFDYIIESNNVVQCEISLDYGTLTLYHNETVKDLSSIMETLSFLSVIESSLSSSSSGTFSIDIKNFTNLNFYTFISLYSVWQKKSYLNNVIFLKETTSPRGLKPNLKFYFKDLTESSNSFDHWFTFNIQRYIGTKYFINYKTKNKGTDFMKKCGILLQKYMNYFGNNYIDNEIFTGFYKEDYNYIPDNITGVVNKLTNLRQKTKPRNMFPSKGFYSKKMCECKLQPIVVDNEDINNWEDYNKKGIVSFPPNERDNKLFLCPSEAKFITLKPNKGDNQKEYPYLPCCRKKEDQNLKNIISNYSKIKQEGKGPITGFKESELKGIKFPIDLDGFLYKRYNLTPQYVNLENSFIACLLQATEKKLSNDKEIEEFRKNMTNKGININVMKQECYDIPNNEIMDTLNNSNLIDSRLYFRFFEHLLNINIFVFVEDGDRIYLETPRYKNFHIRNPIKENKLVLLFRDSNYRYSLLQPKQDLNQDDVNLFYKNITAYYSFDNNLTLKRRNKYKKIVWEKILNGHRLDYQKIDENGKCYAINTMFNKEKITIYIPPSYPLNLPISDEINYGTKININSIMGRGIEGYSGVWYNINKVKEVFIPCLDINEKGYKCKQFIIDKNKLYEEQNYNAHKLKKDNAIKLAQIMMWLLETSKLEVDEFYQSYVRIQETDLFSNEPLSIRKTSTLYKVPSAINYVRDYNIKYKSVFYSGVVNLPQKVYDNMYLYLKQNKKFIDKKRFSEMIENRNKQIKTNTITLLDQVKIQTTENYKTFTSRDDFIKWNNDINDIIILDKLTNTLDKYIYIKDNIFYLIMIFGNKGQAIYVSEYWKNNKRIPKIINIESRTGYNFVKNKEDFEYQESLIIDFNLQYGTYIKLI